MSWADEVEKGQMVRRVRRLQALLWWAGAIGGLGIGGWLGLGFFAACFAAAYAA